MFIIISPPYVNIVLDAFSVIQYRTSLRKQPISRDTTTGFPAKWCLGNEHRNSILSLMTCHYPDLDTASDWSCRWWNLLQPIRSITQIWVVTRHQYGISALVSQTSFWGRKRSWHRKISSFFSGWYHTIRNYSALISHQERLPFILDSK